MVSAFVNLHVVLQEPGPYAVRLVERVSALTLRGRAAHPTGSRSEPGADVPLGGVLELASSGEPLRQAGAYVGEDGEFVHIATAWPTSRFPLLLTSWAPARPHVFPDWVDAVRAMADDVEVLFAAVFVSRGEYSPPQCVAFVAPPGRVPDMGTHRRQRLDRSFTRARGAAGDFHRLVLDGIAANIEDVVDGKTPDVSDLVGPLGVLHYPVALEDVVELAGGTLLHEGIGHVAVFGSMDSAESVIVVGQHCGVEADPENVFVVGAAIAEATRTSDRPVAAVVLGARPMLELGDYIARAATAWLAVKSAAPPPIGTIAVGVEPRVMQLLLQHRLPGPHVLLPVRSSADMREAARRDSVAATIGKLRRMGGT